MRNLKVVLLLVTALSLFSSSLLAQDKIAVVDLGAAIFGSDVAQKRQKDLQAKSEYAALQAKYESTAADIQAMQKEAESKSMTWSDTQKDEFQKKMEYLRADIELTARKLESEARALQNNIVRELQPKALEAIQELVAEEGITVLLRADAVLMAKPEINLTAKLTERLNSKTK
ncbi:MAG: OmpH family outer membrane protein [Porticoccaceae bacterium]